MIALVAVVVVGWVFWFGHRAMGQPASGTPASDAAAATQPATQPAATGDATPAAVAPAVASAPPPRASASIVGGRIDDISANALVGIWINDAGADRIELSVLDDGTFMLDGKRGSYMVDRDQLRMTMPRGTIAYKFGATSDTLVLSGGDLRADVKFFRHTTLGDYWRGFLEISNSDVRRKAVRIFVFIVIAFCAHAALSATRRVLRFLVARELSLSRFIYRDNKNRALTIHSIILNAVKYAIYFVSIGFILSELGINYTTYLASLSVIGLAIGFGSQGLVQDMVTGFFIVLENQFDVGDMVEISGQVGVIEEIGLRMTKLRNYIGETMYIPNRNIGVVGNFVHGAQQAMVDIAIADAKVAEQGRQLLQKIGTEIARQFPGVFIAQPKALDPVTLQTGETFLRLHVTIWPAMVWVLDTQLNPRVLEVFKSNGIEVPGNRIAVSYHARPREDVPNWDNAIGAIGAIRKNIGSFIER